MLKRNHFDLDDFDWSLVSGTITAIEEILKTKKLGEEAQIGLQRMIQGLNRLPSATKGLSVSLLVPVTQGEDGKTSFEVAVSEDSLRFSLGGYVSGPYGSDSFTSFDRTIELGGYSEGDIDEGWEDELLTFARGAKAIEVEDDSDEELFERSKDAPVLLPFHEVEKDLAAQFKRKLDDVTLRRLAFASAKRAWERCAPTEKSGKTGLDTIQAFLSGRVELSALESFHAEVMARAQSLFEESKPEWQNLLSQYYDPWDEGVEKISLRAAHHAMSAIGLALDPSSTFNPLSVLQEAQKAIACEAECRVIKGNNEEDGFSGWKKWDELFTLLEQSGLTDAEDEDDPWQEVLRQTESQMWDAAKEARTCPKLPCEEDEEDDEERREGLWCLRAWRIIAKALQGAAENIRVRIEADGFDATAGSILVMGCEAAAKLIEDYDEEYYYSWLCIGWAYILSAKVTGILAAMLEADRQLEDCLVLKGYPT